MAFDPATFFASLTISLVTGGVGGAVVTAHLNKRADATRQAEIRRGQARMLHEDLLHFQSTLARMFYDGSISWWEKGWLIPAVCTSAERANIVTALQQKELSALTGGLGWMDYEIGEAAGGGTPPDDGQIRDIYRRLAGSRYVLCRLGNFTYAPHHPEEMKPWHDGRTDSEELPTLNADEAKQIADRATSVT